ncbi:hypothetical protein T01_10067 [Trichinella spiralis]|uniref:Uncharacterized protein n=1 Tax=Trichinella spiralis TaxID=6334 RepID=A0A0V1AMX1_TRISP|nr:hypothetical protein T01_1119 [Trichinella spiralis]KRY25914.1 hypothetical protein T01_10067 [Trichinella spiralis]
MHVDDLVFSIHEEEGFSGVDAIANIERRSERVWQQTSPNQYYSKDIPSPSLPVLVSHLRRNSVSLTMAAQN